MPEVQLWAVSNQPFILLYMLIININFYTASKGIGANMLKVGTKRRRTTKQIKAEKEEAALKEVAIQEKMQKIAEVEARALNN